MGALHLHEDLEWGAIGAAAMPLDAGMLGALTGRGVSLSGACGTAVKLWIGGLSTAQADMLVRSALGEHVDADELAMAALPVAAAGHSGEKPSRLPPGGLGRIVDHAHLPAGVVGDSELFRVDLSAHDRAGGHTLERHVAKTEADLRARLAAEPAREIVPTFYDQWTAERAIAEGLRKHRGEIDDWLKTGKRGLTLPSETLTAPVGLALDRATMRLTNVGRTTVVIRKDPLMPNGYYVKTPFVE